MHDVFKIGPQQMRSIKIKFLLCSNIGHHIVDVGIFSRVSITRGEGHQRFLDQDR